MPMTGLSGGQAARVGLAALLLSRFDVLLLDEPTNDLDLDGLARLETFVLGLRSPAVIVSHDREFLARTVNRIVELDLAQQKVGVYAGGYESYLAEREVARRHAREAYEEYDEKLGTLKDRAQTQRNWMAQGVRNARRKSTDNDKIGRNKRVETSEKQAAKARQTEKAIERLDVVDEPRKEWDLRMTIAAAPRSGTVVASATGAVVRRARSRSGRSTRRWTGPTASRSPGRTAQARPRCWARCSAGSRSTRAPPGSGRACAWARSTRRAGCSSVRSRWRGRSATRWSTGPSPTSAPCSPSSG
jgi:energy-coupling factor transporter ATP-binding protein EcfA2